MRRNRPLPARYYEMLPNTLMGFVFRPAPPAVVVLLSCIAVAACTTVGPRGTASPAPGKSPVREPPTLGLFSRIRAPSDREVALQLSARGVQVFRCEKRDKGFAWVFRQPDAELFDDGGKLAGRHGANFSFEHTDGSRLVSTIVANDEAPRPSDLRWLLLTTRSFGKGAFDGVTHVQRIETRGGMPPDACQSSQANQVLRVEFSAEFVFYRAKPSVAG